MTLPWNKVKLRSHGFCFREDFSQRVISEHCYSSEARITTSHPKNSSAEFTNKLHSRHQWSPCCEDSFCLLYTNGVLVQCSEFSVVKRDEDEKIWASRITKYSNWLKKNLFKILNWKKKWLKKFKTNPIFFVSVLNLKKKTQIKPNKIYFFT